MSLNRTSPYRGSLWATATRCGPPRRFFPIPPISDLCYGIKQDYQIHKTYFASLPLNTVNPDDATTFLQSESEPSDGGGNGLLRWTRTYLQIPPSWDDWENVSYTFPSTPGYLNVGQGGNYIGRNQFTPINGVKCRVHRDYFKVGAGQTYLNEGLIPDIGVQIYAGVLNPQFFWDPPAVVPAAGITIGNNTYLASNPSKETYFGWVTNAATYGWASGYDDGSGKWQANGQPNVVHPGQIVISCKPERLMGNIWARVTKYVLAQ